MSSLIPILPTVRLIPGPRNPNLQYGGTIHRPAGPIVREEIAEAHYTAPQHTMNLGDSRHNELLTGLKNIAQKVEQTIQGQKTTEALEETREWRK